MSSSNALQLPSGVPDLRSYQSVVASDLFADLAREAAEFLKLHGDLLADYRRRWVPDPFHQWSRQWEYPFAWHHLNEHIATSAEQPMRILDAGSGVTFFPYLLSTRHNEIKVDCVDCDSRLERVHAQLAARTGLPVQFRSGNLNKIEAPDGYFDAVYCLSVLEHARDAASIVDDLARVLKPGGLAVITIDLSLDGDSELTAGRLPPLIARLHERFSNPGIPPADELLRHATSEDALTTTAMAGIDSSLLPWPHPLVCIARTLLKGKFPRRLGYTRLSVACAAAIK